MNIVIKAAITIGISRAKLELSVPFDVRKLKRGFAAPRLWSF